MKIEKEKNAFAERYSQTLFSSEELAAAAKFVLHKVDENMANFAESFPGPNSENLKYPHLQNTDWTAGFFTGMVWLAYELTQDEKYRVFGEQQLESYRRRLEENKHIDHDLGFLYILAAVSCWRLTGSAEAYQMALKAADMLMERYWEKAGVIQAWGDLQNEREKGHIIIDCVMNIPLLYWAAENGRGKRYFEAAVSQIQKSCRYLIRPDSSTYHTYYFDVDSGEALRGTTAQGYDDDSCWSRGQSWAIYGLSMSYAHTRDKALLDAAKSVANYFLEHLPEDFVPYWDFCFQAGDEERDSSSAAIAACGLLQLSKYLPVTDCDRAIYEAAAQAMLCSLSRKYTTQCSDSNGVLLHAVYSKPDGDGVDECCIWGDYYYLEGLVRLLLPWEPYA